MSILYLGFLSTMRVYHGPLILKPFLLYEATYPSQLIIASTTRAVGQLGRRYLVSRNLQVRPRPLGRAYLASWVYLNIEALQSTDFLSTELIASNKS